MRKHDRTGKREASEAKEYLAGSVRVPATYMRGAVTGDGIITRRKAASDFSVVIYGGRSLAPDSYFPIKVNITSETSL